MNRFPWEEREESSGSDGQERDRERSHALEVLMGKSAGRIHAIKQPESAWNPGAINNKKLPFNIKNKEYKCIIRMLLLQKHFIYK